MGISGIWLREEVREFHAVALELARRISFGGLFL